MLARALEPLCKPVILNCVPVSQRVAVPARVVASPLLGTPGEVGSTWLKWGTGGSPLPAWLSSLLSVFQALAGIGGSSCFSRQVNMTQVQHHLVLLTLL